MRLAQAQIPALFAGLESAGITVPSQARAQFYAFLRLGLAPEDWKSYLGPLVIKDLAQRQVFEQTFDAWMAGAQAELDGLLAAPPVILPPKPGPEAPGPRWRYGVALALIAAGIIYAFIGPKEGPQPLPPPTTPDAGPVATTSTVITPPPITSTGPALAETQKFWVPKLTVVPPPARWPWALGLLGVTGLVAGAINYYARRRRLLAEPPPYQSSEGAATALGLVGQTGDAALLEPEEALGWVAAVQHITADFYTRQLALKPTIDATCRQAGLPKLVFQMGRALQKVWIWVDQTPSARGLENLAQVLTQSLTKNGIEAQRLWFYGLPDQLITQTGAQDAPENYSEDREKAQLWVLTRPEPWHQALDDPYLRPGVHALCRGLAAFKSCALVVAQDPGPLAERLAPWGLKVISVEHLVRGGAPAAPRLDQLQAWAAVLALAPRPVSAAEAQKLRSALQLVVSPRALEHLPGNQHGAAGYGASAETRQKLLRWLIHSQSHQTPGTLLPRALVAWRQLIPEPPGGPARDRWAWQRAFCALLGPLDPSGAPVVAELSPQEALDTLDKYAAQGYAAEIKEATQYFTPADHPIPGRVKLPWAAAQLAPEYRLKMWRLGLWEGPPPELRWAGRTYAALALVVGLGSMGALAAANRPSPCEPTVELSAEGRPQHHWVHTATTGGDRCGPYQVTVSVTSSDAVALVPPGHGVKVDWVWSDLSCHEKWAQGALWRCGLSAPPDPRVQALSMVALEPLNPDEAQAKSLALEFLARGVTRVYLGRPPANWAWLGTQPQVQLAHLSQRQPPPAGYLVVAAGPLEKYLTALRASEGQNWAQVFSGLSKENLTVVSGDLAQFRLPPEGVPPWADAAGRDGYGRWAEVVLKGVKFKLRWIPPGEFEMGSPETEKGRLGPDDFGGEYNEGPRHPVILTEGFWLGETEVTQALWQAVMGDNPSSFKSPTRPVEMVSWDAIQKFLAAVERLRPGLKLGLPSEAQWEYAARAGTTAATYAGDLEILGERNAPILDAIAWYGGNCGVGFELEGGWDTADWREKQYEFSKGGSHPVGQKLANPWGLYDMLGNVWEWCRDGRRRYGAEVVTNPLGPEEPGVARVVRGGSWLSFARNLRAANRFAYEPGNALGNLGFRLCRGPAPSQP